MLFTVGCELDACGRALLVSQMQCEGLFHVFRWQIWPRRSMRRSTIAISGGHLLRGAGERSVYCCDDLRLRFSLCPAAAASTTYQAKPSKSLEISFECTPNTSDNEHLTLEPRHVVAKFISPSQQLHPRPIEAFVILSKLSFAQPVLLVQLTDRHNECRWYRFGYS